MILKLLVIYEPNLLFWTVFNAVVIHKVLDVTWFGFRPEDQM